MHAYLILMYNNFSNLEKLIKLLDDCRNDIYIHVDKKVKDFDLNYYKRLAKSSNLMYTNRVAVKWGGYSMVKAEYILLNAVKSAGRVYDYVHLISDSDLPLVNQDDIHKFFDLNKGCEFIHFGGNYPNDKELERVKYYHFFCGRRNYLNRILTKAESILQGIAGIDRLKGYTVQRGAQWFSITYDFAMYILSQKKFVEKMFKHTFIPDEFFVQTLLINSDFSKHIYKDSFDNSNEQNMRLIDWKRGNPYTFEKADYDAVIKSGMLFVRKINGSNGLGEMIYANVMNSK